MFFKLVTSLAIIMSLMACSSRFPYRIDVDQGNLVEEKALNQLRIGMRKSDVQRLLGTPLLQDRFHQNRWDYTQHYKSAKTQKVTTSIVSLYFTNDLLARIEKDGYQPIVSDPIPY